MLRFDKTGPRRPPDYQSRSVQARLLLGVGLVGGGMLLAGGLVGREGEPAPEDRRAPAQPIAQPVEGAVAPAPQVERDWLVGVVDNAPFRDAEDAAWFYLLSVARDADLRALAASIPEPSTYAQLVSQPAFYRGKGVKVVGSVRRIERVQPAENPLGIDNYFRVTLWPTGGQVWPVVLYSLELPAGVELGDGLAIPVEAVGYFFKNHSYAWEEGVGLAPVLVAPTFLISNAPMPTATSKENPAHLMKQAKASERSNLSAAKLTQILDLANWPSERLAGLPARKDWADVEFEEVARLAHRLKRIDDALMEAAVADSQAAENEAGQARSVSGRIVRRSPRQLSDDVARRLGFDQLTEVAIDADGLQEIILVPGAFPSFLPNGGDGAEVHVVGVAIGMPSTALVAPRLQWTPTDVDYPEVNLGESILGAAGYDVATLHGIADARPIRGSEREPFFDLLAISGRQDTQSLASAARDNLPQIAALWRNEIEKANPVDRKRVLMAKRAAEAAEAGRFSVAPLFLDAAQQRGELVTLDGVARRAVRVETGLDAEGRPSDVPTRWGIDHYYEIDLFTEDSENLPLVFCVTGLPEGFPVGDDIRQPVRVAGFFFKRWLYQSRRPAPPRPSKLGLLHDPLQAAPLLVGPPPIMIERTATAPSDTWQMFAGGGFVLLLAGVWYYLWRASRRRPNPGLVTPKRFERDDW